MKHSDDIRILKQSLKRNQVRIIVWVLAIIAGLAIGGYAGYRHIIMAGWDKSYYGRRLSMLEDKLVALRKKNGHSQQELADRLGVTRQTISNWELGQGAPSLDKAMELAKIYHISLDDLVENQVEIVVKEKKSGSSRLLKCLEGKKVKISGTDMELLLEAGLDWGYNAAVKVLEVNDEWMRIEYTRTKENHFMKKETVVKLIDIDMINGVEIVEEE